MLEEPEVTRPDGAIEGAWPVVDKDLGEIKAVCFYKGSGKASVCGEFKEVLGRKQQEEPHGKQRNQ